MWGEHAKWNHQRNHADDHRAYDVLISFYVSFIFNFFLWFVCVDFMQIRSDFNASESASGNIDTHMLESYLSATVSRSINPYVCSFFFCLSLSFCVIRSCSLHCNLMTDNFQIDFIVLWILSLPAIILLSSAHNRTAHVHICCLLIRLACFVLFAIRLFPSFLAKTKQ